MISVDIILPFYNGSRFVKEQIDSIINNENENISWRLIVINDASSIEESNFIQTLLPANSMYVVNELNLGVIKTIEKGLMISTAPYVMFCDQDDVWKPGKIKKSLSLLRSIENDSPAMVFTDLIITGPNLEHLNSSMLRYYKYNPKKIKPSILLNNIVTGCTIIMNKRLVDFSLPFPSQIPMHDHWLASCATFAGKLELLDEPMVLYRQHGHNQIGAPSDGLAQKIKNIRFLANKFFKQLEIKTAMAKALAIRLEEHNLELESQKVESIAVAFESKNVVFLISEKTFQGSVIRAIGSIFFLFFGKLFSVSK